MDVAWHFLLYSEVVQRDGMARTPHVTSQQASKAAIPHGRECGNITKVTRALGRLVVRTKKKSTAAQRLGVRHHTMTA